MASTWLVVGYSLPAYDRLVRTLLYESTTSNTRIHVFDPDPVVARRFRAGTAKSEGSWTSGSSGRHGGDSVDTLMVQSRVRWSDEMLPRSGSTRRTASKAKDGAGGVSW